MTPPTTSDLFRALDETWPPARIIEHSPWLLRQGDGGGQRVSAATAKRSVKDTDIPRAEDGMRSLNQRPLFMLRPGEDGLDTALQNRGYEIVDPVAIYLMAVSEPTPPRPTQTTAHWPATKDQREVWKNGGINSARVSVMERAIGRKTILALTTDDQPTGVAFLAMSGDIAMLHALEVSPSARRQGIGTDIMHAAVNWARDNDANWLSLMVTRANIAANTLYRGLGMGEVGHYHYRREPQAKP